jgi:C_GCAxxG_C_C family probable redox protein
MNKKELAQAHFQRGFNCSQSVLAAFNTDFGLDQDLALRLAGGFGGGMGRRGETCGAVSGALMVLGLKYGAVDPQDKDGKESAYQQVRAFMERFAARHGALHCNDLLGVDIDTPDGLALARAEDRFKQRCPKFVGDAAEILEEFL